jgi:hypothetical protein
MITRFLYFSFKPIQRKGDLIAYTQVRGQANENRRTGPSEKQEGQIESSGRHQRF